MLPMMFNGKDAEIILKVGASDYIVGTTFEDGFHVVDMKRGVEKLHLFKNIIVTGMLYVGNSLVFSGTREWKDGSRLDCEYHLVDFKNEVIRKVANAETTINSIQLLSKEH